MNLMDVKKDAQEIASSISEIMGVDVVIVDTVPQRIADTFRYPYRSLEIYKSSIIGRILELGRPLLVDNKDYFQSCAVCKDRFWCKMQGLMGVPILYNGETVGAIGLVIEDRNVRHLVENSNLVFIFLQHMADLLAVKLEKAENRNSGRQQLSPNLEHMLDTVDTGVVILDGGSNIIVHNERFRTLFGIESDCYNHPLTEYISHPMVERILQDSSDVADQSLVIALENTVFYGQLQVKRMWNNNVFRGSILSFRDWTSTLPLDTSIVGKYHAGRTLEDLCHSEDLRSKLRKAATQALRPVILHGQRGSERYLRYLAEAVHRRSDCTGRFVHVNASDWMEMFPLEFDLSDARCIPLSILLAHRGTLCISQVFELPVCQQQCIYNYLRKSFTRERINFSARFVFVTIGALPDLQSPFVCRELLEMLMPDVVRVPNPIQDKAALRHQLEQYFKDYAACYHREEMKIDSGVWDLLLEFSWEQCDHPIHKIVENLVRNSSGTVDVKKTRQLLSQLNASPVSVEDFEQEQIQRLLNEGASVEQITQILKISRSTLYRRIKKYNTTIKE